MGDAVAVCEETAKARSSSAPCKSSIPVVEACAPRRCTSASAIRELSKHRVMQFEEDHQAGSSEVHARPSRSSPAQHTHEPVADRLCWPSHQEARGIVSLRLTLTSAKSVSALVCVHHNTLTIHIQSLPGGAFDKKMASIPVGHLIVTLRPRQFELLALSCLLDDAGEIFCFCKDQTARNKWMYILRRVDGVTVVAHHFPKPPVRPPSPPSAGATQVQMLTMLFSAEEVRAKFEEIQEARRRSSAAARLAIEECRDMPVPSARMESNLSQASTCAGSHSATPVGKPFR